MRQLFLALYGLGVGAGYAAGLHFAIPGESAVLPVRELSVVLLTGVYGWCCGKDPFLPVSRTLTEVALFPFALFGGLVAGFVCLLSFVITRFVSVFVKTARG